MAKLKDKSREGSPITSIKSKSSTFTNFTQLMQRAKTNKHKQI